MTTTTVTHDAYLLRADAILDDDTLTESERDEALTLLRAERDGYFTTLIVAGIED